MDQAALLKRCASSVPPQRSDIGHRRQSSRILKRARHGALAETLQCGLLGQFQVPTIGVGQSHLLWCAAIRFEHRRGGDQNTEALGAGSGDIESVQTIKKFHPSRRICMARSGHRTNDHRSFLTLKFVDGSNPSARQSALRFSRRESCRRADGQERPPRSGPNVAAGGVRAACRIRGCQ
jgi:hypothetical protein